MPEIIAIDPGSTESAYIRWNGTAHRGFGIVENEHLRSMIRMVLCPRDPCIPLVIEEIQNYGKVTGTTIFETAFWSGIFCEAWRSTWGGVFVKVPRRSVKIYLCETATANDTSVRNALVKRFGDPGKKNAPNPVTYGLKADLWQALALAVYYWDHHYGKLQ